MACRLFLFGLLAACAHLAAALDFVPGRAFDRFITIWLENQVRCQVLTTQSRRANHHFSLLLQDFAKVAADSSFDAIRKQGILQTRYYAHTHPSQPNYLAAIAGDYWGLDHDSLVRIPENVSTIADLLNHREISWAGAMESMPSPGYLGNDSLADDGATIDYVRKHNPFASYDSVANHGFKLINVRSLDDFMRDVDAGTVPQFVMMSPNMLNDGHDTTLEYATKWSRDFLEPLIKDNSKALSGGGTQRTLIQLTYDETEDYSQPNRVVSLLLGSAVPEDLRGTEDHDFYTHFSILATVQNNWELPNLGRYDVGANVFRLVADQTGYKGNVDPPNADRVNNSVSYPGFLNLNHTTKLTTIPAPNLNLVGAGGKGVLSKIKDTWGEAGGGEGAGGRAKTPYDGKHYIFDGEVVPQYAFQP